VELQKKRMNETFRMCYRQAASASQPLLLMDHGKDSFVILTHPTPSGHNWQIMAD